MPAPVADVGLATMFQEAATRRLLAAFAIGAGSATAFARVRFLVQVAAYWSFQAAVRQPFALDYHPMARITVEATDAQGRYCLVMGKAQRYKRSVG